MSDFAIELQDVAVCYRVPLHPALSLKQYAVQLLQRKTAARECWALQALSLQVARGTALGVVGANGAGKSTLLRVLARVLRPVSGRVRVRGTVAPILELGAGFDMELTGRENIMLGGAMLGQSRQCMERKLPSIAEFAGLNGFMDAPLRVYSTGMVARLGFAVATDVSADVLLVDEALAVGDIAFQQQCLQRLREFVARGTTLVIVSHSPALLATVCTHALWLAGGRVQQSGAAQPVLAAYQHAML